MSFMSGISRRFSLFLQSIRVRAALPYVRGRVLDVGCDSGILVPLLPEGAIYVGVDLDPARVQTLKNSHLELEAYCLDVQKDVIPAGKPFDTLVALAVIEHLDKPREFLERYVPLLNIGSTIVLTTPTHLGERVHRMLQSVHVTSLTCSDLHHKIYHTPELEELLQSYGFDIVEARYFELGMNQLVVGRKVRNAAF